MAKVPGLSRRGNVWQFRIRVPGKFRETIGKGEIVKSLGSVSRSEAARLAYIEHHSARQQFAEAEAILRTEPVKAIANSQLHYLARAYFYGLEKNATPLPFNDLEREELAASALTDLNGVLQSNDDGALQPVARKFAAWAKVRVEEGSPAWFALCDAVQKAQIEHYRREYDRMSLRSERRLEECFRDIDKNSPPKPLLTFSDAVQRYIDEPSKANLAPKTRAAWRFRLGAWIDLVGADKPVGEITRERLKTELETLKRIPSNASKLFPGVSLRKVVEVMAKKQTKPLSRKSVQLYCEALNSFFNYLIEEQILSTNPAQRLMGSSVSDEEDEDGSRRPWNTGELNRFFHTEPFNRPWESAQQRSWLYWMPLLALFSGARSGELAGLEKADVFQIDGSWFVRVRKNAIRRLKNKHSNRTFPVHQTLIRLGFTEFAQSVPDGGPLFADVPPTERGPVPWCQKAIGRRVRKVFSDPTVVFHSLRHNFRDAAREANIPLEIVGAIGGWREGSRSAMAGYGAGPSSKKLTEWMAKIEYPGLTLEHLIPTEHSVPPVRYRQRPGVAKDQA